MKPVSTLTPPPTNINTPPAPIPQLFEINPWYYPSLSLQQQQYGQQQEAFNLATAASCAGLSRSTSSLMPTNTYSRPIRDIMCFRCAESGHSSKQCNTYKVKLCRWWINNACNKCLPAGGNTCNYAHGEEELRQAGIRCVRIVHDNGDMTVEGCHMVGHRFLECPTGGVAADLAGEAVAQQVAADFID